MSNKIPRTPFSTPLSGSAKETELRLRNIFQWKKKRPPVGVFVLSAVLVLSCFGLISCESRAEEPPADDPIVETTPPAVPTPDAEEPVQPSPTPEQEPTPASQLQSDSLTVEHLNLDGIGTEDDTLTLTTRRISEHISDSVVEILARLGTGQEVGWAFTTEGFYNCSGIHAAYLTSTEKQVFVLELTPWGANWDGADYILMEVAESKFGETIFRELGRMTCGDNDHDSLIPDTAVWGMKVVEREDSGLQALRVPTSAGKWNSSIWGTLTWENEQWNWVSDGYYTNIEVLAVDGTELTLALRGWPSDRSEHWPNRYDRIQILRDGEILQTITEADFTPDGHCRYDYLISDHPLQTVKIDDINFDGAQDFGIPSGLYQNRGYCWFLYDPQSQQYRYAFSLSGTPELDSGNKQLVETWQDDYGGNVTYNTYTYDENGDLTLLESTPRV